MKKIKTFRAFVAAVLLFAFLMALLSTSGQLGRAEMNWTPVGDFANGNFSVAWAGSTSTLYSGRVNGEVYSWTGNGPWIYTGQAGSGMITDFAWDPSSSTLYASNNVGNVYYRTGAGPWVDTGGPLYAEGIYSLAWDDNNSYLYAGSRYGYLFLYYPPNGWYMVVPEGFGVTINSLLLRDSSTLYAGLDNGHVYSWSTTEEKWTDEGQPGGAPSICSLAWDPSSSTLYAACWDGPDNGHVYSKTENGPWTDTGGLGRPPTPSSGTATDQPSTPAAPMVTSI